MRNYYEEEYQSFFESIEYCSKNIIWVSKPSSVKRARNKALQLVRAREIGFQTMETIFTNNPMSIDSFVQKYQSVYKSLKNPRVPMRNRSFSTVFTTLLEKKDKKSFDGIMTCPGIIQRFCAKQADIRVTVFGEDVFAVKIESQKEKISRVDFRRGGKNLNYIPHRLPCTIQRYCIELVKSFDLLFGAIDLALTENGYIFFEINPNGQWGWLEEKTQLPMRRSLLNILLRGR